MIKAKDITAAFIPGLLGYSFCRAWILECLNYSRSIVELLPDGRTLFLISQIGACLLLALIWGAFKRPSHLEGASNYILLAGIIGASSFTMGVALDVSIYPLIGFILMGICAGFYEAKWYLYFLRLDRNTLYINVLATILFSCILNIIAYLLRPYDLFYPISIILLVAMTTCERSLQKKRPLSPSFFSNELFRSTLTSRDDSHSSRKRVSVLLIVCLLYSAVHACGATLLSVDSVANTDYFLRSLANFSIIIVLAIVFACRQNVRPTSLLRLVLLLSVGGLLLGMISADSLLPLSFFTFCCGNKVFDILLWLLVVDALSGLPGISGRGACGIVAAKSVGSLVGSLFTSQLVESTTDGISDLTGFVALLILALIVILFWVLSERVVLGNQAQDANPVNAQNASPQSDFHEDALELLAKQSGLTSREHDILFLLARGKNRASIAKELFISQNTVHTHIVHIYQKTGIDNQQDLIAYAERSGSYSGEHHGE